MNSKDVMNGEIKNEIIDILNIDGISEKLNNFSLKQLNDLTFDLNRILVKYNLK